MSRFNVTITETLKMIVEVEAESQQQAEQMVSDGWRNGKYILGADNFVNEAFDAAPAKNNS